MRDHPDLPALLKLRVQVDELMLDFLLFEFLDQLFKDALLVRREADQRLILVLGHFIDIFFLVRLSLLFFLLGILQITTKVLFLFFEIFVFLFVFFFLEIPSNVSLVATLQDYGVRIFSGNYLQFAFFIEVAGLHPNHFTIVP